MNYRPGQRILGNYTFCAVCGEALRKFISSLLMKFRGELWFWRWIRDVWEKQWFLTFMLLFCSNICLILSILCKILIKILRSSSLQCFDIFYERSLSKKSIFQALKLLNEHATMISGFKLRIKLNFEEENLQRKNKKVLETRGHGFSNYRTMLIEIAHFWDLFKLC